MIKNLDNILFNGRYRGIWCIQIKVVRLQIIIIITFANITLKLLLYYALKNHKSSWWTTSNLESALEEVLKTPYEDMYDIVKYAKTW